MSPPRVQLLAPSAITVANSTLEGTLLDNDGKYVHTFFRWRRSGKPHWQQACGTWWNDAPHDLHCDIQTSWPNYQHECQLEVDWQSPIPGGQIYSEIMRFWFIPGSVRGKGAPFLVSSYEISNLLKVITLTVTTDIPVHLKVRISPIRPYSDAEVETKRGRVFKHHPVLVWQWKWEVPQTEPGDTTTHTFTWECPWYCTRYYLQAWGTTDSKTSPSRSPFFTIHPIAPTAPIPTNDQSLYWNNVLLPTYKKAEMQTWQPDHPYQPAQLDLLLWHYPENSKGYYRVEIRLVDGSTCSNEPILWEYTGYSTELPPAYNVLPLHFPLTGFNVDPSHQYRIVTYPILPWYWWTGSSWRLEPAAAKFYVAIQSGTTYYPRGLCGLGCNMYTHTGSWQPASNADNYFCIWQWP